MIRWIVFLFTSLVFLCQSQAISFSNENLRAEDISIRDQDLDLKLFRFLDKDGRPGTGVPVLLAHGITSNLHIFEGLIPILISEGLDVYALNFRGHGGEGERSLVRNYQEGDYRFENMVEIDLPRAVQKIYSLRGEKVLVAGHSMGGMVSVASEASGHLEGLVRGVVTMGSPPNADYQKWDLLSMNYRSMMTLPLYSGSGKDLFNSKAVMEKIKRMNLFNPLFHLSSMALNPLIKDSEKGLVITDNLTYPEDRFMDFSITLAPKDTHRSFMEFARFGYPYKGRMNRVPRLDLIGEKDGLGPANEIVNGTKKQASQVGFWQVIVPGVSHLDLLATKVMRAFAPYLIQFIMNPESLGPRNQSPIELKVLSSKTLRRRCEAIF